jgi:hypothetical protein
VHRRQRAQLVPQLLGRRVAEVAAEPARQLGDDRDVVARAGRRRDRAPHPLHAALAVGDRAVGLGEAGGGRQHDVGQLGGLRQEDVLHDQHLEAGEQLAAVR